MLSAAGCRARRARLWEALADVAGPRPDWIVLGEPRHVTWLSGFYADPCSFRAANAGAALVLGRDGTAVLVADGLQKAFAEGAHVDRVAAPLWYRGKESAAGPRRLVLARAIVEEVLAHFPGGRGAVDAATSLDVAAHLREARPGLSLDVLDALLSQLQRAKDADELAVFERSLAASDAAVIAAMRETAPGMTELDLRDVVQHAAARAAGQAVLVYGDFVAGEHTQRGGGLPGPRAIAAGEPVLIDFSVVLSGYRGDICQTWVCRGRASDELKRMQVACLAVHEAVRPLLVPGTPAREIDRLARATIAQAHDEQYYTSHTGHGLGLGHPDPPYLVRESSDLLADGDVVAIEPGLYVPGVAGLRLEHDYLITSAGPRQLSQHPFELEPG